MIDLPDVGYTPKNYQALVDATKLTPKEFYEEFSIAHRTFNNHKSGNRTMKWQAWQQLFTDVEAYLEPQADTKDSL